MCKMDKRKENVVLMDISTKPSHNVGLNNPFEEEVNPELRISPTTGEL